MPVSKQVKDEAKIIRPLVVDALTQLQTALVASGLGKAKVSIVLELPKSKQIIRVTNHNTWQIKVIENNGII